MIAGASAAGPGCPPLLVRVLAVLLVTWAPLSVALDASSGLSRLVTYGAPAMALLLLRVGVAGLGVAAGRALWTLQPPALQLARGWLVLDAVVTALTLSTPYFPSNRLPGARGRDFLIALLVNGAWFVYLRTSRRVASCWPRT